MVVSVSRHHEFLILVGLALTGGCAGSTDGSKDPSPIPKATAASVDLKPKAAELPERPEGAGEYDADAPQELTPTNSGLYYRILRKGDGTKPTPRSNVVAHYKGWLDDGQTFDSSYERGQPTPFPLDDVIAGWTEGLQLIGEGGMIELEIPSRLGYGPMGRPPKILPGATLHFIVELQQVK